MEVLTYVTYVSGIIEFPVTRCPILILDASVKVIACIPPVPSPWLPLTVRVNPVIIDDELIITVADVYPVPPLSIVGDIIPCSVVWKVI